MTVEEKVDQIDGKLDKILEDMGNERVARAKHNIYLKSHHERLQIIEGTVKTYTADRNKIIGGTITIGAILGVIGGWITNLLSKHS